MIAPATDAPTWLAMRDRMAPLPDGLAMGVPRKLGQLATTSLLSWRGKLRAGLDLILPAGTTRERSLGGIVERRLGREVKERLVEPIFGGIYGSDVDQLDAAFVAPHLANAPRSLLSVTLGQRRAHVDPLRAPLEGMRAVVDALVDGVGRDRLRVNATARGIDRRDRGWRVAAAGDGPIDVDDVVFATPPNAALSIAWSVDDGLADALSMLRMHSTASVVFAFDADLVTLPRVGGMFSPREDAGALLSATIVSNRWPASAPPGTVLVRVLVGGARAPKLVESKDEAAIAHEALVALRTLLPMPAPRWTHVTRFVRSQVFPEIGHRDRVARVRHRAKAIGALHFVGAAYDGGGIAGILARAEHTAAEVLSS
jgi:oxygen-dependent protoporphyrinogen oxidase